MATDTNHEVAETESRPATNDEVVETEPRATETNADLAETETRPDLAWDDEVRGLCLRVHGDARNHSFSCIALAAASASSELARTPVWSLEAARIRAKELRSIVKQGRDPAKENRGRKIPPVENIIHYIAEHLRTKP